MNPERGTALKIAFLLPDLRNGGAERVCVDLAHEFEALGHRVQFVLRMREGELLDSVPPSVTIASLDVRRVRDVLPALHRHLRRDPPDVLVANMWPLSGLAVLARMSSRAPTRLVLVEHSDLRRAKHLKGIERGLIRLVGSRIYGAADAVAAVSSGVADSIAAVSGLPRSRVQVIHNPVRQDVPGEFEDGDRDLIVWWRASGRRLISVGNLKPAKAYDLLLDAFASLSQDMDARLLILGEGPLRSELEAQIQVLNLQNRVRLAGSRQNPFPYLKAADLFVLSSRWEGFGNVIVEALACGTPVVSTDCQSGPAEILEHGRYGRLVPVDDPHALATAMRDALDRQHDPTTLKRRAADFAPPVAAQKYVELLSPLQDA